MAITRYQRLYAWLLDNGENELSGIGAVFGGGIDVAILELARRGISLMPKLQDGQHEVNVGLVREIKDRRARLGISPERLVVGGWSQNRTQAKDDAEKSNGLIAREGVEGTWVTCAEDDAYKGDPGSEPWKRLGTFVDRCLGVGQFSSVGPAQPIAGIMASGGWGFCSLPNEPSGQFYDWESVKRAGGRWIPETYPNEQPDAPNQWPSFAQRIAHSGFPQFSNAYVHPLLGMHTSRLDIPASRYITDLVAAKTIGFSYGFSIYGSHQLTRQDWDDFGAVIASAGTPGPRVLAWTL